MAPRWSLNQTTILQILDGSSSASDRLTSSRSTSLVVKGIGELIFKTADEKLYWIEHHRHRYPSLSEYPVSERHFSRPRKRPHKQPTQHSNSQAVTDAHAETSSHWSERYSPAERSSHRSFPSFSSTVTYYGRVGSRQPSSRRSITPARQYPPRSEESPPSPRRQRRRRRRDSSSHDDEDGGSYPQPGPGPGLRRGPHGPDSAGHAMRLIERAPTRTNDVRRGHGYGFPGLDDDNPAPLAVPVPGPPRGPRGPDSAGHAVQLFE